MGRYTPEQAISADDPIRYINERAKQFEIAWISFGYRDAGTINWWFFPSTILQIPLTELPPLPGEAIYRIIPFDHKIIRDRGLEWSMHLIPARVCPKTTGRRRMGV